MKKNIANKITAIRLILSIIIILILIFPLNTIGIYLPKFIIKGIYIDSKYIFSGALFVIITIIDFIGGYIAKKNNSITDIDKIMDTIVDKVLINGTLIILSAQGFVHPAITLVIVLRDIFTNAFKTIAAKEGKTIDSIELGKYKTGCLMLGILFTFLYNLPFELLGINVAGYLLLVAALLSIISGIQYYNITKKYFK